MLGDQFAVTGQPGKFMRVCHTRECAHAFGIERAGTAHVDIESGVGRSRLDIERFAGGFERLGDRPRGTERAFKSGSQNGAFVDSDDVVRAWRSKTDLQNIVGAAPGMQHRTPAAFTMRVDQVGDGRDDVRLCQSFDHQRSLP